MHGRIALKVETGMPTEVVASVLMCDIRSRTAAELPAYIPEGVSRCPCACEAGASFPVQPSLPTDAGYRSATGFALARGDKRCVGGVYRLG